MTGTVFDITYNAAQYFHYTMHTVFITSDHAGAQLRLALTNKWHTVSSEYKLIDVAKPFNQHDDYPLVAAELAQQLKQIPQSRAIAICGSGQGICMALNRFPFVRAGIGYSTEAAKAMRSHNDANCICLAGREADVEEAIVIIKAFLTTPLDPDKRHLRRIQQLNNLN